MVGPKNQANECDQVPERESPRSPESGSKEEITRKMEELGYLDYGLDI
jgi:hypothetical protein